MICMGTCPRTPLAMRMATPCAACRFATCKFPNLKKKILGPPLPNLGDAPAFIRHSLYILEISLCVRHLSVFRWRGPRAPWICHWITHTFLKLFETLPPPKKKYNLRYATVDIIKPGQEPDLISCSIIFPKN